MALGWKQRTEANWTGLQTTTHRAKQERVVIAGDQPMETKKNNWWKMILILVGGMVVSWGVGVLTAGVGAAIGASHLSTMIASAFLTGAVDLGANILSELAMGRLNKGRTFLFMMPILGMEWFGKINAILKVAKAQKKLINGLKSFVYVNKKTGEALRVPDSVLQLVRKNPQRFLNEGTEWLGNVKFAYKNQAQTNEWGRKYVKNLRERARKMQWDKKHMKQTLWNEFGDESIFNQNVFETLRNAGRTQQGRARSFRKLNEKIDKQGGVDFGEAIVQRMFDIKQEMLQPFASRFGGSTLRYSSSHLQQKMNFKLNKFRTKKTVSSGMLHKTTSFNPKIVGFKDIVGDSAFGTLTARLTYLTKVVQSYTKLARYANPMLLIRKAGSKAGKLVGNSISRIGKITLKPTTILRLKELNKKIKSNMRLDFIGKQIASEVQEKQTINKAIKVFNLIPVKSQWIIGYNFMVNMRNTPGPKALQIFFNPLTTRGRRKNIFGKKPVWSAPMNTKQISQFRERPGDYYLKNIAYGYDYATMSLQDQVIRNSALPIQGLLYGGWRLKRDWTGMQRAVNSIKNEGFKNYDNIIKRAVAPQFFRGIATELGVGYLLNPFTTRILGGGLNTNSLLAGGRTFISSRVTVARRKGARRIPKIKKRS